MAKKKVEAGEVELTGRTVGIVFGAHHIRGRNNKVINVHNVLWWIAPTTVNLHIRAMMVGGDEITVEAYPTYEEAVLKYEELWEFLKTCT